MLTNTAQMIAIAKNPENVMVTAEQRLIVARMRNPSRVAAIAIPNTSWAKLADVPEQYRPLLEGVLHTAAKDILSRYLSSFTTWPSEMPAHLFSDDAILEQASGANSDWMDKEALESAWKASATRKAFIADPRYTGNPAYRKAVSAFESLILKFAGKSSQYKPEELDKILAKLADDDLQTEMGMFVIRRIEAIRNKPVAAIDLDIL